MELASNGSFDESEEFDGAEEFDKSEEFDEARTSSRRVPSL